MPHIYAETEEHGYYGLGYALAEDRLPGLLLRYLKVQGRLASVFGPDSVDSDFNQLRWRHLEEARAGFHRMSPQLQTNYRHFVAGISRYMEDHPDEVPEWALALDPVLPVAAARARYWGYMVMGGLSDCRAAGVRLTADVGQELESPNRVPAESNAWVLMPWRTADGVVIHLADSHGGYTGGQEMVEFRLHAGSLSMSASQHLGSAFMQSGHTRYHAWAYTNTGHNVSDCYEVEVDPANPRRFRFDGAWRQMETQEVSVPVKGGGEQTRTFEYTRHNDVLSPVVARVENRAYIVSTPYMHRAGMLDEQKYRLQQARNIEEFYDALRMVDLVPTNFMVGEAHGNALYVKTGRVPIRPPGYDWTRPVPGNTSATAWRGVHSLEDLVQIRNPPQGYMQNANIAPTMMMEDSPLTPDGYPEYIYNEAFYRGRLGAAMTNTRGMRTVELLSKLVHATLDDVLAVVLDEKWVGTEFWQRALAAALSRHPREIATRPGEFRRFAQRLLRFDGQARQESVEALNYYFWRTELSADPDGFPALREAVEGGAPLTEAQQKALIAAVDRAIVALRSQNGNTELTYGDVFRVGRGGYSWPMGGGGLEPYVRDDDGAVRDRVQTLRNSGFFPPDSVGLRWLERGQRNPTLTIFTDPIQSFGGLQLGQSGRPESLHYSDQARLASKRRLKPMYFDERELLERAVSRRVLSVPPTLAPGRPQ